jgi:hypothetical protein
LLGGEDAWLKSIGKNYLDGEYDPGACHQTVVVCRRICKIAKTTVSFVMSLCLSAFIEQISSRWTAFDEI